MSMPADAPRRPRLLAQNRKLRHLRGLSLRNLTFVPPLPPPLPPPSPPHVPTLRSAEDSDDGPPRTTSTSRLKAKKLTVLQEPSDDIASPRETVSSLRLSRSSENLPASSSSDSSSSASSSPSTSPPSCLSSSEQTRRPRKQSRRDETPPAVQRRASLSLALSSPVSRQKKLENLADAAVGDVFFSLHDPTRPDEPVYVSEIGKRSANFDFRFFNLSRCASSVARSCKVLIRIWTRRPKHESWIFLLEELIDLRRLRFISTTLNRDYRPNALIFHLEDGVYSLDFPNRIAEPRQAPPLFTSSYNALMKLANLEGSIQDAQDTQHDVILQMNDLIEAQPVDGADVAEESVVLAKKYLAIQRRLNRQTERRRDELRESLRARREAITAGHALQRQREDDMAGDRERLCASRRLLDETVQQIRGQRRRICADLARIFPIMPIPSSPPLSFQICGIPLPNSIYDATVARTIGEDALSAALGLVALLTRHLQFYLGHPLPYEIAHQGSRSYVRDDISHLVDDHKTVVGPREFPLFLPRGGSTTNQWRFEYAWFLLNKDLEALCTAQGLRVVDIRHTLPNLKYLLYVGSAGRDEMPQRKKGGVRGLWTSSRLVGRRGDGGGGSGGGDDDDDASSIATATGSRPGSSADSDEAQSRRGCDLLRCAAGLGGRGQGTREQQQQQELRPVATGCALDGRDAALSAPSSFSLELPFDGAEAKFTLRTKGLRENVAS